jgi:hypothetical protein
MDMFSKNITDADMRRQVDPLRKDSQEEVKREQGIDAHADPTPLHLKALKDLSRETDQSNQPIQDDLHPDLEEAYKQTERALQRLLNAAIAFCDGIISEGQLRAVRELLKEQEQRLLQLEGRYTPPFIEAKPVPSVIPDPEIVPAPPIKKEPDIALSPPITQDPEIEFVETDSVKRELETIVEPSASPSELTGMLISLEQKIARLERDYQQGRINASQYRAIQKHYLEQKEVATRLRQTHPDSDRWRVVLEEGKTSFLLQLNEATVRYVAFYDLKSHQRIFSQGEIPVDAEEAMALLGTFSSKEIDPKTGRMVATHTEDGSSLILIPGRFTAALVSFSQDPPGWQVRALREVHRNFEAANRVMLERAKHSALIFPNIERFFKS